MTRRAGKPSRFALWGTMTAAALASLCGCSNGSVTTTSTPPSPTAAPPKLVAYLPDYHQSYALYAKSLDFSHMTHLLLAFGHAPLCNGTCTASSDMTITMQQQTDADIDTLVTAAHQAGVKVLLSLGGGDNAGDATFSQFYNVGLSAQLAASVNNFVSAHNLDGVDVDIEDATNMGQPYADFVQALANVLHPEGKLLSAAMGQSLQKAIPDAVLGECDFINVLTFSTDAQAIADLQYYAQTKSVPVTKIVLGVPFFGRNADQSILESYATILAAYPNAWQSDEVSGGSLDGGIALYYVGESTMATETKLGAQYGGIMVWELSQDAPAPHSLLKIIQTNL
jgi:chitinase